MGSFTPKISVKIYYPVKASELLEGFGRRKSKNALNLFLARLDASGRHPMAKPFCFLASPFAFSRINSVAMG